MDSRLVVATLKSPAVAAVLSIVFGGVGLLYASIAGGIVMTIAELLVSIFAFITLGFGGILFFPLHLTCVIWSLIAVSNHNKRILQQAG